MANAKRMIDRLVRSHRKWLAEVGPEVLQRSHRELDVELREGSLHSIRALGSTLQSLATYYGIKGSIEVLDGGSSGWNIVHLSCHCHLWTLAFKEAAYKRLPHSANMTQYASRTACSLCYAIVCDLGAWSQRLTALLSEMASGSGIVDEEYWKERCLEPFVLRLSRQTSGNKEQLPVDREEYGVYAGVVAAWNDGAGLAESLVQVCDYHCDNMEDTGDWDPEFDHPPFDLIPWELLAIRKARQLAGLTFPAVNHPLATSALMECDTHARIGDETLRRVEAAYSRVCAGE